MVAVWITYGCNLDDLRWQASGQDLTRAVELLSLADAPTQLQPQPQPHLQPQPQPPAAHHLPLVGPVADPAAAAPPPPSGQVAAPPAPAASPTLPASAAARTL